MRTRSDTLIATCNAFARTLSASQCVVVVVVVVVVVLHCSNRR